MTIQSPERNIYSVSRLNMESRLLLESHFNWVWVSGEVSNLSKPVSGHWYFTLKDEKSQIRAAMFRMQNRAVNFTVKDGLHVVVLAKVSLYPERGDYQLIIERMEEEGLGVLQRAFDALKNKLSAEGLFLSERKKTLPTLPRTVGIITSPTGAAIHDILTTLKRRYAAPPVIIYPTEVQGKSAAPGIIRALRLAEERQECDVLIIARGGGSLEDLWAFNEETVARAIAACSIPIVTGIGHEVDITIADFVADQRAATPTAAAELVTPDQTMILQELGNREQILISTMERKLDHARLLVKHCRQRLRHPTQQLQQMAQHLDFLSMKLHQRIEYFLGKCGHSVEQLHHRLMTQSPAHTLQHYLHRLSTRETQLQQYMNRILGQKKQELAFLANALHTISPLATLERGYSITLNQQDQVIKHKEQVRLGESIRIRITDAELYCQVEKIQEA